MRSLVIEKTITRRDEKSIQRYLVEIARHEVLTPEEEVKLFQQYNNGDKEALEKIVRHNLRFVVSVAKQYQHVGLKLGDLINEGNIGLIKAAERFDVTRGFKFISYAVWWIRQAILQAINEKGRKIRMPLNQQSVSSEIQRAWNRLLQIKERKPNLQELAEETGYSIEKVKNGLERYNKCTSIDASVITGEDTPMATFLADDTTEAPDHDLVVRESQAKQVDGLLSKLPPREAFVVRNYFGIGQSNPMNLDEIGDHIGVSRERVRQIKDRGIRKLRRHSQDLVPVMD